MGDTGMDFHVERAQELRHQCGWALFAVGQLLMSGTSAADRPRRLLANALELATALR